MSPTKLSWQLRALLRAERFALPLWRWALKSRLKHGKETQTSHDQKLMLHLNGSQRALPEGTPLIWGHAVGVGEVLGLLGLFRRLSAHLPGHHFLLTSTSRTSGEALARQNLPVNFHHQFSPADHPEVMARFLHAWQPQLVCWSEADLWPCMVWETHQRNIPMFMFNVRMSFDKARSRRWLAWFYQPLMACFERIYAQNAESRNNLSASGLEPSLAGITGNIKALAPALHVELQHLKAYQALWKHRPIWLLASSHAGEESVALQAHLMLKQAHPDALLIIAPRDAFRGTEIVALAQSQGLTTSLRSPLGARDADCDVYVANTMGELGLWYALCPVALIGGSLVPIGGHNPYEAIAAQCRVLSGSMTSNFSESYEELHAAGLAHTVTDAHSTCEAVLSCWQLPRLPLDAHSAATRLLDDVLQAMSSHIHPSMR